MSALPIGLGAWAPIYAGVRARVRTWTALGVLWSAITLAGWLQATIADQHGTRQSDSIGGLLIIVGWVGAVATSFMIRSAYERRMASPLLTASERAERALQDRRQAREIARRNPTLAREIGIGRPDVAGATDEGLVDVNNASAAALARIPGIDEALATKIVEVRAEIGGFSSLEDMGGALDLDGDLVERMRDHVIFLPR